MTTSLKKLLLISITMLLGVMSDGVMATAPTTNYDFSSNGPFDGFSNVYGTFSVNSSTGALLSGTLYEGGTGMTGGTADPNGGAAVGWLQISLQGAGFIASDPTSYIYIAPYAQPQIRLLPVAQLSTYGTSSTFITWNSGDNTWSGAPNGTITQVGGAPEIDGSLAPKVGFLLGCLFLMFGRKKQNTEALITV